MLAYNFYKFPALFRIMFRDRAIWVVITQRKNAKRLPSATLQLNVATIYIMARYLEHEWS